MRKLFTLNDTTKSGFVETNRLAGILATIGQVFDEEELDDIIEGVDVEGKRYYNLEPCSLSFNYNIYTKITYHPYTFYHGIEPILLCTTLLHRKIILLIFKWLQLCIFG